MAFAKTEIAALKHLNHPNIIPLEEVLMRDPSARQLIVTWAAPPCDGKPISRMGVRTRVKPDLLAGYIKDIAQGLDCLHSNHVAHRSMTFDSIIIGQDGVARYKPRRPHPPPNLYPKSDLNGRLTGYGLTPLISGAHGPLGSVMFKPPEVPNAS